MQLRVLMLWHKEENSEEEKEIIISEQRAVSSEHYPLDGAFCSPFFARCSYSHPTWSEASKSGII